MKCHGLCPWVSTCLREVNHSWKEKFDETLLLSPAEDEIPIEVLIGPTSDDFDGLADCMLELQKTVVSESRIESIKKKLDYASFSPSVMEYEKLRTIGFIRLFFRVNGSDQNDGESSILYLINELRNCKGHSRDTEKVLEKLGVPLDSPRTAYLGIMARFCDFLLAFRMLTEKVLGVAVVVTAGDIDDPWKQLQVARDYFRDPY